MSTPPLPKETIQERLAAVRNCGGNVSAASAACGISRATMQATLARAKAAGAEIPPLLPIGGHRQPMEAPGRLHLKVRDGIVLVASDPHYWPGVITTAHRAFVQFCKDMRPQAIVMNGDVLDGASISRHSPLQWEDRPSVQQELETCKDRLGEITIAGGNAVRYWLAGNHCLRYEARLAQVAPEYARVHGFHLKDHFSPDWQPAYSLWINEDVVIKHRFRMGVHGPHNSTMWAGKTIVTGHRHGLGIAALTDYRGTRWGVDTGTLAEPYGPQFEYTEDSPRSWRSGFAVLTFVDYQLMWPEVVYTVSDGVVGFRGQRLSV